MSRIENLSTLRIRTNVLPTIIRLCMPPPPPHHRRPSVPRKRLGGRGLGGGEASITTATATKPCLVLGVACTRGWLRRGRPNLPRYSRGARNPGRSIMGTKAPGRQTWQAWQTRSTEYIGCGSGSDQSIYTDVVLHISGKVNRQQKKGHRRRRRRRRQLAVVLCCGVVWCGVVVSWLCRASPPPSPSPCPCPSPNLFISSLTNVGVPLDAQVTSQDVQISNLTHATCRRAGWYSEGLGGRGGNGPDILLLLYPFVYSTCPFIR